MTVCVKITDFSLIASRSFWKLHWLEHKTDYRTPRKFVTLKFKTLIDWRAVRRAVRSIDYRNQNANILIFFIHRMFCFFMVFAIKNLLTENIFVFLRLIPAAENDVCCESPNHHTKNQIISGQSDIINYHGFIMRHNLCSIENSFFIYPDLN